MTERIVVFTTMKNEGPYMLEWVSFHRSLGVDHFLIFTNDCDDGTDEIAQALESTGWVTHVPNEVKPGTKPQRQMLDRVRLHPIAQNAAWHMCLDVDEFWNIRVGDGTFPALIDAVETKADTEVDAISFAWKLFGTSGNVVFNDQPVTRTFTMCDRDFPYHSGRAAGLKTLFRNNGKFEQYGPHRPKGTNAEILPSLKWSDAGGNLFPADQIAWRAWRGFDHSFGRIHHYSVRSLEGFLIKRDRGRTNHIATDQAEEYWLDMNANRSTDLSIFPRAEASDHLRFELLENSVLQPLHKNAITWHCNKIREIQERQDWAPFRTWLEQNLLGSSSEPASTPNETSGPQPEPVAPWLANLAPGGHGRGFLRKADNYALQYTDRDSDNLVISFDNLSEVNNRKLSREAWGWKFFSDQGFAHVGVFARKKAWYRDPEAIDLISDMASDPVVRKFKNISLVGTSMGGFAALAFAPLFPRSNIIAFNPQVTLDERIVPWEERYRFGIRQDWNLPFSDGRVASQNADKVYVIYDPCFDADRQHAEMISGPNVSHLKCWYANHYCAPMLMRLDLLKPIMRTAISGELTEGSYYPMLRARRRLPRYFRALSRKAAERGHDHLLSHARRRYFDLRKSESDDALTSVKETALQ